MGSRPADALAFRRQGRAFLARSLAGRGRDRADRGEALPEFIMQLARETLALLVLDLDQALRQRVALRERRLKAAGKVIEHIADRRKLGEVERQTRREVAGGKALK